MGKTVNLGYCGSWKDTTPVVCGTWYTMALGGHPHCSQGHPRWGEGGKVNIEFSTFVCLVLCLSHPITCTGYWGATLLDVAYLILPLNNGRLQGLAICSRNLVTMILRQSSLAVRTCLQSLTPNNDSINSVSMFKQCICIYIYTYSYMYS